MSGVYLSEEGIDWRILTWEVRELLFKWINLTQSSKDTECGRGENRKRIGGLLRYPGER